MKPLHTLAVAALAAACLAGQGAGKPHANLLKNGDFEGGLSPWWESYPRKMMKVPPRYERLKERAHGGKACAQVTLTEAGTYSSLVHDVPKSKDVKHLHLEGWVDWTPDPDAAAKGSPLVMITFSDESEKYDNRNALWPNNAKGWTKVVVDTEVPPGAAKWMVRCGVQGQGTARFDDLVLTAGTGVPSADASETVTLLRAHGDYWCFQSTEDVVDPWIEFSFPFPFESQTPLVLKVTTDPPDRLASLEIIPDVDNRHLCVHLKSGAKDAKCDVRFEALVLVRDKPRGRAEKVAFAPRAKLPSEVAWYFDKTPGIDPDDPGIQGVAKAFKTDTMGNAIDGALAWMRANMKSISGGDQGGKATFERKGAACTGHANLGASLFQAAGLPCRVLGCLMGERLQEHYIVQVWAPGEGWRRVEATTKSFPIPDAMHLILHVAHPTFFRSGGNVPLHWRAAEGCRAGPKYGGDSCWQGMARIGSLPVLQTEVVAIESAARDSFRAWEKKPSQNASVPLVTAETTKKLAPNATTLLEVVADWQKK